LRHTRKKKCSRSGFSSKDLKRKVECELDNWNKKKLPFTHSSRKPTNLSKGKGRNPHPQIRHITIRLVNRRIGGLRKAIVQGGIGA